MIDLSNGDAVHAVRAHGLLWLLLELLDEQVVLRRIVKVKERHRRLLACIVLFVYLDHVQRWCLLVLLLVHFACFKNVLEQYVLNCIALLSASRGEKCILVML